MSIIFDYADIASRMKGDLKPEAKVPEQANVAASPGSLKEWPVFAAFRPQAGLNQSNEQGAATNTIATHPDRAEQIRRHLAQYYSQRKQWFLP
jgi:hypothetical protein